ncbi:hypothetical protein CAP35_10580 [Chitinophagaceae bacterium IBVUCB1]|nr:hypothetical protein CAP35_10580 [Chitinophagaceae bacterium IBVUCB1]
MKKIVFLLFTILFSASIHAQSYIFFLHNSFLEIQGEAGVHPEYGKAEYSAIINKFRDAGFVVVSELRKRGTDAHEYAAKVSGQIDSLLKMGVKAEDITVVGTSKGSYIAMCVSGLQRNKKLNFVFIASCDDDMIGNPRLHFYGSILSIYEKSDVIGKTCEPLKQEAGKDVVRYKEIELNTGLKHGFLYKPMDEWMQPAIRWAKKDYK